jgi:hypothetical protein
MTPFQEALLALEIAVDALHATAKASPEAEYAAQEAFDQIRHLGFDVRHSAERKGKPARTWAEAAKKPTQGKLFP